MPLVSPDPLKQTPDDIEIFLCWALTLKEKKKTINVVIEYLIIIFFLVKAVPKNRDSLSLILVFALDFNT